MRPSKVRYLFGWICGCALVAATVSCGDDDNAQALAPCESEADCSPGHACVDHGCSSLCSEELCAAMGERYGCRGGSYGECDELDCSRNLECLDSRDVCDVDANRCFPKDSSCVKAEDCPYWGYSRSNVDRLCDDMLCRILPKRAPSVTGLMEEPTIAVDAPTPAYIFQADEEVAFSWRGAALPASALVLTSLPRTREELGEKAIWGGVARRGQTAISWAEGRTIVAHVWKDYTLPPPQGQLLYLVVLGLEDGGLAANSALVPFAVESGWLEAGQVCKVTSANPTPCAHPTRLQTCIDDVCRVVCSSDSDCDDGVNQNFCERSIPETDYLRLCSLQP